MEYIIDFIDPNGDYDSTTILVEDDDPLCELINEIISNKNIKEVTGVEEYMRDAFEDEEEY